MVIIIKLINTMKPPSGFPHSPIAVHCGSQPTNLLIINAVTSGAIIEFVIVNSYYHLLLNHITFS